MASCQMERMRRGRLIRTRKRRGCWEFIVSEGLRWIGWSTGSHTLLLLVGSLLPLGSFVRDVSLMTARATISSAAKKYKRLYVKSSLRTPLMRSKLLTIPVSLTCWMTTARRITVMTSQNRPRSPQKRRCNSVGPRFLELWVACRVKMDRGIR